MGNTIMLLGQPLTVPEAEDYLKRLKSAYELHKEKEQFFFDNQLVLVSYAKYLIEYLEDSIKRKGGKS